MHPQTIPYEGKLAHRQPRWVAALKRWLWWAALTAPLAAYLIGFLLPLSLMIGFAFRPYSNVAGFGSPSLGAFTDVAASGLIIEAVINTASLSLAVVAVSAMIGFPLGLQFMASGRKLRTLLLIIVVTPLLINAVVRTFGWYIFFSTGGPFESMFGLRMHGSMTAVGIALVHQFYAYMVISLLVSLSSIPGDVVAAAKTLGASRFMIFRRIILPYSLPGLVSGGVIVFGLSAGAILAPLMLGGGTMNLLTIHIYRAMLVFLDPQRGMALGTLLLMLNIVVVVLSEQAVRRMRTRSVMKARRSDK